MVGCAQSASEEREGAHPYARSGERRAPRFAWVKVEKEYVFDTTEGKKTLAELFGRNSQLIVHHFMWLWDQGQGCPSCSLEADHAEGALVHLENHDVTYVRRARRLANWRHTNSGWDGPPNGRHPMATISTTTTRRDLLQLSDDQGRIRRASGPERFRQG